MMRWAGIYSPLATYTNMPCQPVCIYKAFSSVFSTFFLHQSINNSYCLSQQIKYALKACFLLFSHKWSANKAPRSVREQVHSTHSWEARCVWVKYIATCISHRAPAQPFKSTFVQTVDSVRGCQELVRTRKGKHFKKFPRLMRRIEEWRWDNGRLTAEQHLIKRQIAVWMRWIIHRNVK